MFSIGSTGCFRSLETQREKDGQTLSTVETHVHALALQAASSSYRCFLSTCYGNPVYDAVQQDRTVLDWLATGIIAIEQIPDLQALGISPTARSPRTLLERPDLESYVLSLKERDAPPTS
jgi:hypothetical protein